MSDSKKPFDSVIFQESKPQEESDVKQIESLISKPTNPYKNNNRPILIAILVVLVILLFGGGYFAYSYYYKDSDSDGLIDREEEKIGTDSTNPDTDADGIQDGEEVSLNLNPLEAIDDASILSETTQKLFTGSEGTIHFWTRSQDWHSYEYRNLVDFVDTSGSERILIRKATTYGTTDDYLSFIVYPTGKSYSAWSVESSAWNDNEWIHVAIVWEFGKVAELYMNGTKLTRYTNEEHATNTVDNDELAVFRMGGTIYANGRTREQAKNSQILGLTFADMALSASEIAKIFGNGVK